MKGFIKTTVMLFLVVLVLGSVFAGGRRQDTQARSTAPVGQREYGTTADGPFGAYAQPITVHVVKGIHSTEADRWSQLTRLTGETLYDNRWTRLFEQELNIKIEYMWVVDESQFQQRWQLVMASGQLPDVRQVSLADMKNMDDAGLIHPDLAGIYNSYASPDLKEAIDAIGFGALEAVTFNGQMKAIPHTRANTDDVKYTFIREDWLDAVGMKAPTTIDEMMDVMQAFVTRDPDRNGRNDTFGISAENSLWYHFGPIFWAYGANPEYWVRTSDGRLAAGLIQQDMKEPLRKLQEMYSKGYMDPEFPLKSEFQAKPLINANRVGINFAGFWEVGNLGPLLQNVPTAKWGVYPLPKRNASDPPTSVRIGSGVTNGWVINKNFTTPEAIVKMLNLALEMHINKSHIYHNAEVSDLWAISPVYAFNPRNSLQAFDAIYSVQQGQRRYQDITPAQQALYDSLNTNVSNLVMYGQGERSSLYQLKQIVDNNLIIGNQFFGLPTPTMIERQGALEELTRSALINIIANGANVDSTFDRFVSDWRAQGGDRITTEVNQWYQSQR